MQIKSRTGVSILCCYSQKDEILAHELEMHLSVLRRQGLITAWYDHQIESHKQEEKDTPSPILQAQIILLLISPDSIASDYWHGFEMKRMLTLHDKGDVRIIPILLRSVKWNGTPFGNFQEFLPNGKPVTSWSDPNEAFYIIAKAIRVVVKDTVSKGSNFPALIATPSKEVVTRRRVLVAGAGGAIGFAAVIGALLVLQP